jgi:hypothetical protein
MLCLSKSQSLFLDVKESFGIMKGVAVKCCFTVKPLLLPPLAPPLFFYKCWKVAGALYSVIHSLLISGASLWDKNPILQIVWSPLQATAGN